MSPGSGPAPDPGQRFLWLAAAAMLMQVALGAALRGFMAGIALPIGHFPHSRDAHSHLGYYGVLFPLLWWAWARAGLRVPGRAAFVVYALATLGATLGFAREGYGLLSIAGSTLVLLTWLGAAGSLGRELFRLRSWWAPAGPAILGAALAIPAVAYTLQRDPALARELVQGFLTLLLFGAFVPAALARAGAPAPLAPLWTLGALGTALVLGPWPQLPARALALVLALQVARAAWALRPWDRRLLWLGLALSQALLATGLLAETWPVAIAGLHFAILGPVLLELGAPLVPRLGLGARLSYLAVLGVLTLAVLSPQRFPPGTAPRIAAAAGALLALAWVGGILARGGRPPDGPRT